MAKPSDSPRYAPGRGCRRLAGRSACRSRIYAGSFEVAVEMPLALLVALFEEPAVAAFRIGQDLPAIIVAIPKEKAVGAVLEMRLGDFLEPPHLGLGADRAMRLIHFILGANIEAVVVEEVHLPDILAVDDRDRVRATEPDEQRDRAGLHDFEAEKLLVEPPRERQVAALQRTVREKVELQCRRRFCALRRGACVVDWWHLRPPPRYVGRS